MMFRLSNILTEFSLVLLFWYLQGTKGAHCVQYSGTRSGHRPLVQRIKGKEDIRTQKEIGIPYYVRPMSPLMNTDLD